MPNVTAVNALGDYFVAADRLAIIDGEGASLVLVPHPSSRAHVAWIGSERGALAVDPWRPDTPHADEAPLRADTVLRPFKVIPGEPLPPLLHAEPRPGARC